MSLLRSIFLSLWFQNPMHSIHISWFLIYLDSYRHFYCISNTMTEETLVHLTKCSLSQCSVGNKKTQVK